MSYINLQLKNKFIKQKARNANLVWLRYFISVAVVLLFIASVFLAYSYSVVIQNKNRNQNQNNSTNQNIATNSITSSSLSNISNNQENSNNNFKGVKSDICSKVNYNDDKANVLPEYIKYYEKNKTILSKEGDFKQSEIFAYSSDEFVNYYFEKTPEKLSKEELKTLWIDIYNFSRLSKDAAETDAANNSKSALLLKEMSNNDKYLLSRITDFTIGAIYKSSQIYLNKNETSVGDTLNFNYLHTALFGLSNDRFNTAISKNLTQLIEDIDNTIENRSENNIYELNTKLWQFREIFSLNKTNINNFNTNNLYQLGLCRLKADYEFSKQNIVNSEKYKYLENYKFGNDSKSKIIQNIDQLINSGYSKNETEYKILVQEYYSNNVIESSSSQKSDGYETRIIPIEIKTYKELNESYINLLSSYQQEINSLFNINAKQFFTNQEYLNSSSNIIESYKTCLENKGVTVEVTDQNSFSFKYKVSSMLLYLNDQISESNENKFSIYYKNECEKTYLDQNEKNVDIYLKKISLSGLANESKFKDDNLF